MYYRSVSKAVLQRFGSSHQTYLMICDILELTRTPHAIPHRIGDIPYIRAVFQMRRCGECAALKQRFFGTRVQSSVFDRLSILLPLINVVLQIPIGRPATGTIPACVCVSETSEIKGG